jgi:hypothetical protein
LWVNYSAGFAYHLPWVLDGFGPKGVILLWLGWTDEDTRMINNKTINYQ